MTSKPLTILVDVDDVVADLVPEWLSRYNFTYRDFVKPSDITTWEISDFAKQCSSDEFYEYLHDPELYRYVQPVSGAKDGIRAIRDRGHEVIFATSCCHIQMSPKFQWMIRHGFLKDRDEDHFIPIRKKHLLIADALIDDGVHNLEKVDGIKVVFDRPWNRSYTQYDYRMTGWDDVDVLLDKMEDQLR